MEQICRICRNSSPNLVNIFADQDTPASNGAPSPSLADIIKQCTNCHIEREDTLPQHICLTCIMAAQNAYRFKQRYSQSHHNFCKMRGIEDPDKFLVSRTIKIELEPNVGNEPVENEDNEEHYQLTVNDLDIKIEQQSDESNDEDDEPVASYIQTQHKRHATENGYHKAGKIKKF